MWLFEPKTVEWYREYNIYRQKPPNLQTITDANKNSLFGVLVIGSLRALA